MTELGLESPRQVRLVGKTALRGHLPHRERSRGHELDSPRQAPLQTKLCGAIPIVLRKARAKCERLIPATVQSSTR